MRCRPRIIKKDGCHDTHTLILSVSDGPETYNDYPRHGSLDMDGEGPLTDAIADGVNKMIDAALENEAGRWIEDHEVVFVVRGTTGQGPDVQTWSVKAFLSDNRAHRFCYDLNRWCNEHGLIPGTFNCNKIIDPTGAVAKHPLDPDFRVDGGTEYAIVSVPLDMFDPVSE
jgi:hypothetical protein